MTARPQRIRTLWQLSWPNSPKLHLYRQSKLRHNSETRLQCREQSWCFFPHVERLVITKDTSPRPGGASKMPGGTGRSEGHDKPPVRQLYKSRAQKDNLLRRACTSTLASDMPGQASRGLVEGSGVKSVPHFDGTPRKDDRCSFRVQFSRPFQRTAVQVDLTARIHRRTAL